MKIATISYLKGFWLNNDPQQSGALVQQGFPKRKLGNNKNSALKNHFKED